MSNTERIEIYAAAAEPKWISPREFAERTGISLGVLANWRTEDRKRGYIARHRPRWRLFAGTVRYWAGDLLLPPEIPPDLLGEPRRGPGRSAA